MYRRLVLGWVCLGWTGQVNASDIDESKLVAQLQEGGWVLFLRHPQTNPDQADTDPLSLENVRAQRMLTDEGRRQARAIGQAWRDLRIPISSVTASKFQRAVEAATLLGVGEVLTSTDVTEGGLVVSPNENKRRAKELARLLSMKPRSGTNAVIVSHRPNLQDAAGKEFGDLAEAEVVVFRPLENGKFEVLARIAPAEKWTEWASKFRANDP
jgi:phosphohistidine phosphatase SixA